MANEENLIPNSKRSPNEVRENGRKGGIASGKSRRRKKYLNETIQMMLSLPVHKGALSPIASFDDFNGANVTVEERLLLEQIKRASKGDTTAFNALMNLAPHKERPTKEDKTTISDDDDSFIEALNAKAAEVWDEEKDETDTV